MRDLSRGGTTIPTLYNARSFSTWFYGDDLGYTRYDMGNTRHTRYT
jgi:hypothetical protein